MALDLEHLITERITDPATILRVELDLRGLRMWHWSQAKRFSALRERWKTTADKKQFIEYSKHYNRHMMAVQTLNSLFPLGDTAEQDEAKS